VYIPPEKAVLEMNYTALGGTLNSTHSLTPRSSNFLDGLLPGR